MRQISSNKIVSLHMEPCKKGCPHSDICYLRKRKLSRGFPLPTNFREAMLNQGFTIHESVCKTITDYHANLLLKFPKYNITVSYPVWKRCNLPAKNLTNQIQVSVYNEKQALEIEGQKLFLIKNAETLKLGIKLFSNPLVKNLHFNLDMNRSIHIQLLLMQDSARNLTLDTCLYSWIVNGECPYRTDYIDISYDWTVRRCPFSVNGTPIPKNYIGQSGDYSRLFNLKHNPDKCTYEDKYKGKMNG